MTERDPRRTGRAAEHAGAAGTAGTTENTEYRIAHVRERLVREDVAELGMRFETRGGAVLVTGTAPTSQCRDTIVRIVQEELADVPVRTDIAVAEADAPDHPEELA